MNVFGNLMFVRAGTSMRVCVGVRTWAAVKALAERTFRYSKL